MKKTLLSIGVIGFTLSLLSCQWQQSVTLTITQYSLTNDSIKLNSILPSRDPISISVSYEITDENDEVSKVVLVNGQLVDGELSLDQKVSEPTEVVISVNIGSTGQSAWTTAVLRPDSVIEFVVIHKITKDANYYLVEIKGRDHRSKDELLKFSIEGSGIELKDTDPELLQVRLIPEQSPLDRSVNINAFYSVLVDEGKFSIEGDLDEPTLFTIEVTEALALLSYVHWIPAILEPGVNYRIVPSGNQGKYVVLADRDSLHTQLVSSWQLDPKFVALVDSRTEGQLDAWWDLEREAEEEHKNEQIRNYQVAEQCAHVSLADETKLRFGKPYRYSYQKTGDLIRKARSDALRKILRDTRDAEIARMIFDLNWLQSREDSAFGSAPGMVEEVAILEELALKMDEEFVDKFIKPRVAQSRRVAMLEERNSSLLPGHIFPNFSLTSLAGETISLSDVLSENELVLIDFWNAECYLCIDSFSALREIYDDYKDHGFEIVTISIDKTLAEWEHTSMELNLPWIDLGDTKDGAEKSGSSTTATDYGIHRLPNRFLIDEGGCIIDKHLTDYDLEQLLTSR